MNNDIEQERVRAVQRFLSCEKPQAICTSLGRPTVWLYKWLKRHVEGDVSWSASKSKQPINSARRAPAEIEDIVKMVRLNLYNQDLFWGVQAIF